MNNPKKQPKARIRLLPTQIILIGFASLILLGTLLLILPVSSRSGEWTNPLTASFTAVSAGCVTGLVAVDTACYWSLFGQLVILFMIQIGGLGFMSFMLIFSLLIKRRISPRESVITAQSLGFASYGGFGRIAVHIVAGTFMFEAAGAVALGFRFVPVFGFAKGVYMSVFHSVSAFCNAGFDLMGNFSGQFSSLTAFRHDPVVNITVMLLIVMGGIGFLVWEDILSYNRAKGLGLYAKLVIITSGALILAGTAATFLFEKGNPDMTAMNDRIFSSFFQSVSTRTAGFNTVGLDGLSDRTKFFYSLLMLAGGSSGSTAGGVKTATVALLVISALQLSLGKKEVTIFKRRIEPGNILNAFCVFMIALILICASSLAVSTIENANFIDALFECSSAFNTVGMSLGVAQNGHAVSKIILMVLMFCGRVGILTLTYSAFFRRSRRESAAKYPVGNITVG